MDDRLTPPAPAVGKLGRAVLARHVHQPSVTSLASDVTTRRAPKRLESVSRLARARRPARAALEPAHQVRSSAEPRPIGMTDFAFRWMFGDGVAEGVPFAEGAAIPQTGHEPDVSVGEAAQSDAGGGRPAPPPLRDGPVPRGRIQEVSRYRISRTPADDAPAEPAGQPATPAEDPVAAGASDTGDEAPTPLVEPSPAAAARVSRTVDTPQAVPTVPTRQPVRISRIPASAPAVAPARPAAPMVRIARTSAPIEPSSRQVVTSDEPPAPPAQAPTPTQPVSGLLRQPSRPAETSGDPAEPAPSVVAAAPLTAPTPAIARALSRLAAADAVVAPARETAMPAATAATADGPAAAFAATARKPAVARTVANTPAPASANPQAGPVGPNARIDRQVAARESGASGDASGSTSAPLSTPAVTLPERPEAGPPISVARLSRQVDSDPPATGAPIASTSAPQEARQSPSTPAVARPERPEAGPPVGVARLSRQVDSDPPAVGAPIVSTSAPQEARQSPSTPAAALPERPEAGPPVGVARLSRQVDSDPPATGAPIASTSAPQEARQSPPTPTAPTISSKPPAIARAISRAVAAAVPRRGRSAAAPSDRETGSAVQAPQQLRRAIAAVDPVAATAAQTDVAIQADVQATRSASAPSIPIRSAADAAGPQSIPTTGLARVFRRRAGGSAPSAPQASEPTAATGSPATASPGVALLQRAPAMPPSPQGTEPTATRETSRASAADPAAQPVAEATWQGAPVLRPQLQRQPERERDGADAPIQVVNGGRTRIARHRHVPEASPDVDGSGPSAVAAVPQARDAESTPPTLTATRPPVRLARAARRHGALASLLTDATVRAASPFEPTRAPIDLARHAGTAGVHVEQRADTTAIAFPPPGGQGSAEAAITAAHATAPGAPAGHAAPLSAGATHAGATRDASASAPPVDLDAIYEGMVDRLRRDILVERERMGDLIGDPLR